jgi:tRNA A-37 threonylcarbamoyl transferase component Bud32
VPELDTGGAFLLRRYRHGGLLRWVTGDRYADPDRPLRELELSDELRRRGLRTPRIVAFRARRTRPFGWRLELVSERVPGALDLETWLSRLGRGTADDARRRRVARAVGAALAQAHLQGFAHVDLQPKNLLVEERTGSAPLLWWIDLDACALARELSLGERRANLARLARAVEKRGGLGLAARDLARVLAAYEPERLARRAHAVAVRAILRRGRWRHRVGRWLEVHLSGAGPDRCARAVPTRGRH